MLENCKAIAADFDFVCLWFVSGVNIHWVFELWASAKWTLILKGKFSSGIEGTLASNLNHDFNWKLSEMILCIFL